MIPKILHQLWKDRDVPARLQAFQQSWRRLNPGWEFRLWTDAELRDVVARDFPDFLPVYDGYQEPIRRADAARYLLLRRFGGLYADLDMQCLKPIDPLLAGGSLLIGLEPESHVGLGKARERGLLRILCPSLIASVPDHPFWELVEEGLHAGRHEPDVLDATGPFLLTRLYEGWSGRASVSLLPSPLVYPTDKTDCWEGRLFDIAHWERATREAYTLHYWDGSWFRGASAGAADRPARLRIALSGDAPPTESTPGAALPAALPLVSCLMATRDRVPQALLAIECFRRQTYENRELVIVDDGVDGGLAHAVEALRDPRIRYFGPDGGRPILGRARNRAVDLARGAYVCQWDDDDLYDPLRLELQMTALLARGAQACLLARWAIWWPEAGRLAISRQRPWEGSLLCEKAVLPRYPELERGEDTPVVERILRDRRVAHLDEPRLYLYVVHGRNTFPAGHFDEHWQAAEPRWDGERGEAVLSELGRRLPLHAYRHAVRTYPARIREPLARGRALLAGGRLAEAGEIFAALRVEAPDHPDLLDGLARVAARSGRPLDALALWDRLLSADPVGPLARGPARIGRGWVLLGLGRFAEAEADFVEAVRHRPGEILGHLALGEAAVRRRDWPAARDGWRRVLALDPAMTHAVLGMVTALVELGRMREAEAFAERHHPVLGREEAVLVRATILQRLHRSAELVALLDAHPDLVAANPSLQAVHFHAHQVRGDTAAARAALRSAGAAGGTLLDDLVGAAYGPGGTGEGRRTLYALWREHGSAILTSDLLGLTMQAVGEAEGEEGQRALLDAVEAAPLTSDRAVRLRLLALFERLRLGDGSGSSAEEELLRIADAQDPRVPVGHWAEALRRFATGFQRLAARYPAFRLDSGWRRASAEAVADRILEAHHARRPFSLIRLGDGEGNFLPYPPGQEAHAEPDRNATQCIWWGAPRIDAAEAAALSGALVEAVRSADVVGVPDLSRLCYGLPLPTPPFLFQSWHDYRGLLVILHHLTVHGEGALFRADQAITSCHIHADLAAWGQYERLFAAFGRVSLVTCHPGLPDVLAGRFGLALGQLYRVPHEAKYAAQFGYGEAGEHYPDIFRELERTLAVDEPGEVFLVAAGFLGKMYCDWIKARGGIALDIGSVVDHWCGYSTRSLHFLQRYAAGEPPVPSTSDPSTSAPPSAQGVAVFGQFSAGVGLGIAARGLLAALDAAGVPYRAFDLDAPADWSAAPPAHAVTIVHTNPDLLAPALTGPSGGLLAERLRRGTRIGVWAWESATSFPAEWRDAFAAFDEIWAPSSFAAEGIRRDSPIPVEVIPHVVAPAAPSLTRAALDLPEDRFLFAFLFDELSGFDRKNPLGAVEAFRRAFPGGDEGASLVIKARSLSPEGRARLEAAIGGHPAILLRIGETGREEALGLIALSDAYLSLHRAEGFGLTVAEAMALGTPTIATACSGTKDFLSEDCAFPVPGRPLRLDRPLGRYSAGTVWTEPDLDAAARIMRSVFSDRVVAEARADRGILRIRSMYGAEAVGARVAARLAALGAAPPRHRGEAPSVLVLTPVRNARRHLPAFLAMLERLDHPRDRLSLAFLEGDSDDDSHAFLEHALPRLRSLFRRVELMKHDQGVRLAGPRWAPAIQKRRRAGIAKARNRLLQAALRDEEWVLWVDADVIDAPPDALSRLIAAGRDIVVPNCVLEPGGPTFDLNSFQLTTEAAGSEEGHRLDGLVQPPRGVGRRYLDALRGQGIVPLDGVGGTMLLIRADLHREGLIFPPFGYRGYIETEGLAMMAKDMGIDCWGHPAVEIRHAAD